MARNRNGEENGTDPLLLGMILTIVIFVLMWFSFHAGISASLVKIRAAQLDLIGMFWDQASVISQTIKQYDPSKINISLLTQILSASGSYTRWIYMPFMVFFLVYVMFNAPLDKFKKVHTMASLKEQEVKVWPYIAPTVGLELVKGDILKGKWAVAQTEREFTSKHGLLDERGELIREKASKVFSSQLGEPWSGYANLKPYQKGIFAGLMLFIEGDRKGAEKWFGEMAVAFKNGDSDYSFADTIYQKYANSKYLAGTLQRHFYVNTVFATLFQLAKVDGVAASSLFVWLKPTDRRLWYTLNAVGGYAFFVECSGIMSHWLAEKSLGDPIITPATKTAVDGLHEALLEFCEDDELERIYK